MGNQILINQLRFSDQPFGHVTQLYPLWVLEFRVLTKQQTDQSSDTSCRNIIKKYNKYNKNEK